jgi:hypothetical protein
MLTVIDEGDSERVLTVRIQEAAIDTELINTLGSVLASDVDSVTGVIPRDFPGGLPRGNSVVASQPCPERHAVFRLGDGSAVGLGPGRGSRWEAFPRGISRVWCVLATEVRRSRQRTDDFPARCGPDGLARVPARPCRCCRSHRRDSGGCRDQGPAPGDAGGGVLDLPDSRRLLLAGNSAATELAKAARYQVRIPITTTEHEGDAKARRRGNVRNHQC